MVVSNTDRVISELRASLAAETARADRLQQALADALNDHDAETARADAAEAALKTAREAITEIEAVVGCLEGKDPLDRELIRNIKASIALIKEPRA